MHRTGISIPVTETCKNILTRRANQGHESIVAQRLPQPSLPATNAKRLRTGANGSRECAPDDRLRDEAIHPSACGAMDCFAALAMTGIVRRGVNAVVYAKSALHCAT